MRANTSITGNQIIDNSYVYLNNKNKGWVESGGWQVYLIGWDTLFTQDCFSYLNEDGGTRIIDLEGDGLFDLVTSWNTTNNSGQPYIQQNYVQVNDGISSFNGSSGWTLPGAYAAAFVNKYWNVFSGGVQINSENGVLVGDITGNGFPDFVQSIGSSQGVYINQYPQGSKSFSQNTSYTFPSNINYTDFSNKEPRLPILMGMVWLIFFI